MQRVGAVRQVADRCRRVARDPYDGRAFLVDQRCIVAQLYLDLVYRDLAAGCILTLQGQGRARKLGFQYVLLADLDLCALSRCFGRCLSRSFRRSLGRCFCRSLGRCFRRDLCIYIPQLDQCLCIARYCCAAVGHALACQIVAFNCGVGLGHIICARGNIGKVQHIGAIRLLLEILQRQGDFLVAQVTVLVEVLSVLILDCKRQSALVLLLGHVQAVNGLGDPDGAGLHIGRGVRECNGVAAVRFGAGLDQLGCRIISGHLCGCHRFRCIDSPVICGDLDCRYAECRISPLDCTDRRKGHRCIKGCGDDCVIRGLGRGSGFDRQLTPCSSIRIRIGDLNAGYIFDRAVCPAVDIPAFGVIHVIYAAAILFQIDMDLTGCLGLSEIYAQVTVHREVLRYILEGSIIAAGNRGLLEVVDARLEAVGCSSRIGGGLEGLDEGIRAVVTDLVQLDDCIRDLLAARLVGLDDLDGGGALDVGHGERAVLRIGNIQLRPAVIDRAVCLEDRCGHGSAVVHGGHIVVGGDVAAHVAVPAHAIIFVMVTDLGDDNILRGCIIAVGSRRFDHPI